MARRTKNTAALSGSDVKEVKNLLIDKLDGHVIVADTSALLIRGTDLLRSLPDCTLIIPAIVVKELEGKRSAPTVGFLAREWLRLLESLRVAHGVKLSEGVPAPEGFGSNEIVIRIEPNHSSQTVLPAQLQDGSNDSTILAVTKAFSTENGGNVALISNDVPMRMHCTLELEIPAYEVSSVTMDAAKPFSGSITVEVTDEHVEKMFGDRDKTLNLIEELIIDQIGTSVTRVLAEVVHEGKVIEKVLFSAEEGAVELPRANNRAKGISPKTVEQRVAMSYLLASADKFPIVSIAGSAGTGKTLLTIAAGLEGVKKRQYQKVLVFRSLHEMGAGQEMGFLPGSVEDKMGPWSGAVMDSIEVIAKASSKDTRGAVKTDLINELKTMVEVSPISYLRGRSITDTFMVLDEAQNFSRSELLNILSRVGEGTKIVLVADPAQVDNKFLQTGPRAEVWSVIDSLKSSNLFGHVTLVQTERSAVAELAANVLAQ